MGLNNTDRDLLAVIRARTDPAPVPTSGDTPTLSWTWRISHSVPGERGCVSPPMPGTGTLLHSAACAWLCQKRKFLPCGLETAFLRQICASLGCLLCSQPGTMRHQQMC